MNPENIAFILGLGKTGQVAWSTLFVKEEKAGLCFSEAVCPAAQGWVVVALRMRLSPSAQEGLVVLGGDKGRLSCTKQVFGEGFKVRCTKELSDIYDFCKTQVFTV